MPDQVISVGFGKVNFSRSTVSLSAFVVTEEFERALPSKVFARHGQVQRFPASEHPDINGSLYLDSVRVPDGTVIMLQASHKSAAMPVRDGAIFIATRAMGTGFTVHANLTETRESTLGHTFLAFQGRGEILTIKELADYGIAPYKNFINAYTDEEEIAECYTVTEIAKAIVAKPTFERVKDSEGDTILVPQKPARRLRLRGN